MNVFEVVKQSVTTRQAAESYGIRVNRTGMACCPFHSDRHPSMKVDNRYHCFACGVDGDVIDFVSKLYGIGLKDAAEKLAADFNICYDNGKKFRRKLTIKEPTPEQLFKKAMDRCCRILSEYLQMLHRWERVYAPENSEEEWNPLFIEALQKKSYTEYLIEILLTGSYEDKAELIASKGKEVIKIERRMAEFTTRNAAGVDKYSECHAGTDER